MTGEGRECALYSIPLDPPLHTHIYMHVCTHLPTHLPTHTHTIYYSGMLEKASSIIAYSHGTQQNSVYMFSLYRVDQPKMTVNPVYEISADNVVVDKLSENPAYEAPKCSQGEESSYEVIDN